MPASPQIQTQVDSRQYIVFKNFETMDTQAERVGLPANRLSWLENLQPIAGNKLASVPGPSAALTTIPGVTIYRKFSAAYNVVTGTPPTTTSVSGDFEIAFGTDGSAYQVNLGNGFVTLIAPAGTFSDPDMTTWQNERVIGADPTAGYWTWDGTIFIKSGGVSPVFVVTAGGAGYTAATVVISGGSGSGATATAAVVAGSVVSIQLTNAGINYRAGDVLVVTISGDGTGATATAKVFPVLAFAPKTIAVAFGRVWTAGGRLLNWTGTLGYDDSNPANAAGFTTLTDVDLVHEITALRTLNNFLYIFGDNSIKQIGTVTVSGAATIFAITTLSSDTGTTFRQSIASYNRLVHFCNHNGVWAVFGATVEKISDEMDGIFPLVDFTQPPQAIVITINSIRCYLLLVRYNDPVLGPRALFLARQRKKWFVVSQGASLISCCSAVIGGRTYAFASSGSDVTPILSDATVAVSVLVQTALTENGKDQINKRMLRIGVTQNASGSGQVTLTTDTENSIYAQTYSLSFPIIWVNSLGQAVTWLNALAQLVTFQGSGFMWQEKQAIGSGIYLGCSLSGIFTGFRLNTIVIEYEDATLMRSRNKA